MKLSSLQSVTFLPIFRVRVHLCDEKCCTSFPGRVLLEERRQPSRLSRHWNALVSPLFSIFAHTHAWGISRTEGWCARRHFPSLGREDPLEEGMATHSSILAWRIPMDGGSWQATVHQVAKSQLSCELSD